MPGSQENQQNISEHLLKSDKQQQKMLRHYILDTKVPRFSSVDESSGGVNNSS